jgi:hypothetical protein
MAKKHEALAEMDTEHLKCRTWMHPWDVEVTYSMTFRRSEHLEIHLYCERCGGQRIDLVKRSTGELMRRRYIHPEGYMVEDLKSWGGRSTFNANVRVELYERYAVGAKKKK